MNTARFEGSRRLRRAIVRWLVSRVGLVAAGLLLAVALLELLVSQLVPLVWMAKFMIPDPLLGWRHPPNAAFTMVGFAPPVIEWRVHVTTNSLGFVDREHRVEKADGLKRILILGDSFAEAVRVHPSQSLTVLLEELLRADGTAVEVINLAMGGFGTDQQLLTVRHLGARFRPDVVLLFFTPANDVRDNSKKIAESYGVTVHQKAFFLFEDGRLVLVPFDYERVVASRDAGGGKRYLRYYSNLYHVALRLAYHNKALLRGLWALGLISGSDHVRSLLAEYPDTVGVYSAEYSPIWEDAWRVTEALLLALRAEVSAIGAHLVIAVAPSRELVYRNDTFWQPLSDTYPAMNSTAWDLERPGKILSGFCREHALRCLDLVPAMRTHVERMGERLHFKFDGHWNEAGNRFVADQVRQFLKRQRLLETRGDASHPATAMDVAARRVP